MMRVLFDYQMFQYQKFGGITRYFSKLLQYLPQVGVETSLAIRYANNLHLKEVYSDFSPLPFQLKGNSVPVRAWNFAINRIFEKANHRVAIKALLKSDPETVFHPTYYDTYFLKHLGNRPLVITVHDMIHEKFPEYFKTALIKVDGKRVLCERANHIIAVSENTKSDLVALFGLPPEKITVVYHGIDQSSVQKTSTTYDSPYVLFVGARDGYKQFQLLLQAFHRISGALSDLELWVAGKPFSSAETSLISELGISDRVKQQTPSDQQLADLYTGAFCFVYPSEYEGFGIPILEAWQAGCPVILSDTSCFPEIGGDAALYFKSKDAGQLADCLKTLWLDKHLRSDLIIKGNKRLKKFSWQRTAQETKKVYQQVCCEIGMSQMRDKE